MKNLRQEAILEIIDEKPILTQEMLVDALRERGWNVTQATISRDIKALGLRKSTDAMGSRYVKPLANTGAIPAPAQANSILNNGILTVTNAQNFVIIRCYAGMAGAVCATIDSMHIPGVAGSIAGDDTIFICMLDNSYAENARKLIMETKE